MLFRSLDAAIMNPYSVEMMKTYHAFNALDANDDNCANYISFASTLGEAMQTTSAKSSANTYENYASELQRAIAKGLKDSAASLTESMLASTAPLDIVQNDIIPALDIVGVGFEKKTVFLPGLLMSAEAAKAAFEKIKEKMPASASEKCTVIMATVKGDIHDIGKNIVKLLLENYGFNVIDLGRDVPPELVADTAVEHSARIVGLSALMTTTVPAMEDTIKLLRERAPWVRVVVGGAVLTQEYADAIGADKYAKDAMEMVRYAEEVNNA